MMLTIMRLKFKKTVFPVLYCLLWSYPTPHTCGHRIENTVSTIVQQRFGSCAIVACTHNKLQVFDDKVTQLTATFGANQNHDIYLFNLASLDNGSNPCKSPLGCFHKYRPNCVITIILTDSASKLFLERLQDFLIPLNFEISRKDTDYYLIHTSRKVDGFRVLLSDNFGMHIKYKLLLIESELSRIEAYTACFYCNNQKNYGEPMVVKLNLNFENSIPNLEYLFPDFVKHFNGFGLRVSVSMSTHQLAQIRPTPKQPGEFEKWRGSYFFVLDELGNIFNFTYKVRPSTGGGTGLQLPNGTWVGTTGDVYNDVADIGFVTAITFQRYKYVGFNYALSWEWLTYATAIPKPKVVWEAILWPFNLDLWFYFISSTLLIILSTKAVEMIITQNGNISKDSAWPATTFAFGTILEQNVNLPNPSPLRIISAAWLIFGIVMGTGYKSNLVTALGFPVFTQSPQSFQELALSGYAVGLCYVGGAAYSVFNSSSNPTYVKLANRMKLYPDITECFVTTLKDKTACIGYDSMANYVLAKNLTDRKGRKQIIVSKASTFFVSCGFAIKKRAIFRQNFDGYIMQWDDMAILSKWRKMDFEYVRKQRLNWERLENINVKGTDDATEYNKLNMGSLKAIFICPCFGLILGTLILLLEIVRGRIRIHLPGLSNTSQTSRS